MTSALSSTTDPTTLRIPRTYAANGVGAGLVLPRDPQGGRRVRQLLAERLGRARGDHPRRRQPRPADALAPDRHPSRRVDRSTRRCGRARPSATATSPSRRCRPAAGSATVSVEPGGAAARPAGAVRARPGLSHVLLASGLRLTWNGSRRQRRRAELSRLPRRRRDRHAPSTNSFDDTAVTAGRHVYTVYAQDGAGNRSAASAPYVVTVPAKQERASRSGPPTAPGRGCACTSGACATTRRRLTAKARDASGIKRARAAHRRSPRAGAQGQPGQLPLARAARAPPHRGRRAGQARQPLDVPAEPARAGVGSARDPRDLARARGDGDLGVRDRQRPDRAQRRPARRSRRTSTRTSRRSSG